MSNIELPEATLIDIKKISKNYQSKLSACFNYSELFDLDSYYTCSNNNSFGCRNYYMACLTRNITERSFLLYTSTFDWRETNDKNVFLGIRPVFKYSKIKEYSEVVKELASGYLLITFGEYPDRLSGDEKKAFPNFTPYSSTIHTTEGLKKIATGNVYTVLSVLKGKVHAYKYPEILFEGIEGKYVMAGKTIYKVKPVYFLVDVNRDFAISQDILFALPTLKDVKLISSYRETLPYKFLNEYFVPELMQHVSRAREEIESQEIPEIKNLIDKIILTSENSVLQKNIRTELQALINEYNTCLDCEKESGNSISLNLVSSDTIFIQKLESLLSKITNYPYYKESKIVYECLNINIEDDKEVDSELYRDLVKIYKYILPTLPEGIRLLYQTKIKEILLYVQNLIIKTYQTSNKKDFNIELLIREMLQPVLESLYADVTKNYVLMNLNDIINGIFASSKDKYLAHLFNLLNEEVKAIESLITITKKYEYKEELKQILSLYNENNNTITNITNIYLDLLKLKQKLEQLNCKRKSLERKKIKRTII